MDNSTFEYIKDQLYSLLQKMQLAPVSINSSEFRACAPLLAEEAQILKEIRDQLPTRTSKVREASSQLVGGVATERAVSDDDPGARAEFTINHMAKYSMDLADDTDYGWAKLYTIPLEIGIGIFSFAIAKARFLSWLDLGKIRLLQGIQASKLTAASHAFRAGLAASFLTTVMELVTQLETRSKLNWGGLASAFLGGAADGAGASLALENVAKWLAKRTDDPLLTFAARAGVTTAASTVNGAAFGAGTAVVEYAVNKLLGEAPQGTALDAARAGFVAGGAQGLLFGAGFGGAGATWHAFHSPSVGAGELPGMGTGLEPGVRVTEPGSRPEHADTPGADTDYTASNGAGGNHLRHSGQPDQLVNPTPDYVKDFLAENDMTPDFWKAYGEHPDLLHLYAKSELFSKIKELGGEATVGKFIQCDKQGLLPEFRNETPESILTLIKGLHNPEKFIAEIDRLYEAHIGDVPRFRFSGEDAGNGVDSADSISNNSGIDTSTLADSNPYVAQHDSAYSAATEIAATLESQVTDARGLLTYMAHFPEGKHAIDSISKEIATLPPDNVLRQVGRAAENIASTSVLGRQRWWDLAPDVSLNERQILRQAAANGGTLRDSVRGESRAAIDRNETTLSGEHTSLPSIVQIGHTPFATAGKFLLKTDSGDLSEALFEPYRGMAPGVLIDAVAAIEERGKPRINILAKEDASRELRRHEFSVCSTSSLSDGDVDVFDSLRNAPIEQQLVNAGFTSVGDGVYKYGDYDTVTVVQNGRMMGLWQPVSKVSTVRINHFLSEMQVTGTEPSFDRHKKQPVPSIQLESSWLRFTLADDAHFPKDVEITGNISPESLLKPEDLLPNRDHPTSAEILRLEYIDGKSISELEHDMRPGQMSELGFVGHRESLTDVLWRDNEVVRRAGLNHQDLKRPLLMIKKLALQNLLNDAPSSFGHRIPLDGEQYRLHEDSYLGGQGSPFDGGGYGSSDFKLQREDHSGEEESSLPLQFPSLIDDLIDYGFYEGFETPFRTAPESIIRMFPSLLGVVGEKRLAEIVREVDAEYESLSTLQRSEAALGGSGIDVRAVESSESMSTGPATTPDPEDADKRPAQSVASGDTAAPAPSPVQDDHQKSSAVETELTGTGRGEHSELRTTRETDAPPTFPRPDGDAHPPTARMDSAVAEHSLPPTSRNAHPDNAEQPHSVGLLEHSPELEHDPSASFREMRPPANDRAETADSANEHTTNNTDAPRPNAENVVDKLSKDPEPSTSEPMLAPPLDPQNSVNSYGLPETQRRYHVDDYITMWQRTQGREITSEEATVLSQGCIGVTKLNIGQTDHDGLPPTNLSFADPHAHQAIQFAESVLAPGEIANAEVKSWRKALTRVESIVEERGMNWSATDQHGVTRSSYGHIQYVKEKLEKARVDAREIWSNLAKGYKKEMLDARREARIEGDKRTFEKVSHYAQKFREILATKPATVDEFMHLAKADSELAQLQGIYLDLPSGNPSEWKVVIFSKHFWSGQEVVRDSHGNPVYRGSLIGTHSTATPDATRFKPDRVTGQVDMSGDHLHSKPGYVNFDYGLYDEQTGNWWHANHCDFRVSPKFGDPEQDPMKVYQSTPEQFFSSYSDFDSSVICIAFIDKIR